MLLQPGPTSYLGLAEGFLTPTFLTKDIFLYGGVTIFGSLIISTVKSKKNQKGQEHFIRNSAEKKKTQNSKNIHQTLSACTKVTVPTSAEKRPKGDT